MDAFSGSQNGRTLVTTAKTGCLSSPLVMKPRLGAKERSKSTGWSSSTVICVRGAGQGCFFRYKTGSISVTGSLSAARTRVYDTNPPLVGLVGLVFSDYRRYAWFSCRSSQHCRRGLPLVFFGSRIGPRGGINETSQTRDLFYSATKEAQFLIPAAAWPMLFIRVLSG